MMKCFQTVKIDKPTDCNCMWNIGIEYPCESPVSSLYPGGVKTAKLYGPVQVNFADGYITLTGAGQEQISFSASDTIIVDGQPLMATDVEAYFDDYFCCKDMPANRFPELCGEIKIMACDDNETSRRSGKAH